VIMDVSCPRRRQAPRLDESFAHGVPEAKSAMHLCVVKLWDKSIGSTLHHFTKFSQHVASGCSSLLLRRSCIRQVLSVLWMRSYFAITRAQPKPVRWLVDRLVTCTSDCERLERENCILERRLDDEHQRTVECERHEQEAVQRVRDTLQLVDEAQIDKEQVGSASANFLSVEKAASEIPLDVFVAACDAETGRLLYVCFFVGPSRHNKTY